MRRIPISTKAFSATVMVTAASLAVAAGAAQAASSSVAGPPPGAPGSVRLVSASAQGVAANGDGVGLLSQAPVLSADHSKVAFRSASTNLVPGLGSALAAGDDQAYVKSLTTGAIALASASAAGVPANASASQVSLSSDGSLVGFQSTATNLVPGAGRGSFGGEYYVKNIRTGAIEVASSLADGTPMHLSWPGSPGSATLVDAGHVIINNVVSNLDPSLKVPAGRFESFEKDLATGRVTVISSASDGTPADKGSLAAQLIPGTHKAIFASNATNLIAGVTGYQVYLKNLVSGALTLVSATSTGVAAQGVPIAADDFAIATPRSNEVLLSTTATNFPGARSGGTFPHHNETYLKNLTTGALTLVSSNAQGVSARTPFDNSFNEAALSPDGKTVALAREAYNLVPGAPSQANRIYLKDLATGRVTLVAPPAPRDADYSLDAGTAWSPDSSHLIFRAYGLDGSPQSAGQTEAYEVDVRTGAVTSLSAGASGTPVSPGVPSAYVDNDDVLLAAGDLGPAIPAGALELYLKHVDR